MLTLTDISYTYPSTPEPLFEHVSASFQQGWTAVLGDNGLGKTTVINALLDSMPEDVPHPIIRQQTGEAVFSQTMRRLAALQGKERSQVLPPSPSSTPIRISCFPTKRHLRANYASSCCVWAFLIGPS